MKNVRTWLEQIDLGGYADAFEANAITLDLARDLNDADLEKLGVAVMGHRKILLRAIDALRGSDAGHTRDHDERPSRSRPRDAERRQITVMFCDLVGSTALSEQLDPEDLREVMRAYQDTSGAAIARFEGHVAQTLGDGLMVYFGYPVAHEDDAQRAVWAGLDILAAIETLNRKLAAERDLEVAVRIGIHTGHVVAGEVGGIDTRGDMAVVGDTPNVAARVEAMAQTNTVVVSGRTHRLVETLFDFEELGAHNLKGVAVPVPLYRVRDARKASSRFEVMHPSGLTPFVGRDEEIGLLNGRWGQARDGEGQVVLLCGEPGIGKSRITSTFRQLTADDDHIRLQYQCSPFFTNSAFYPFIQQFEFAAGIGADNDAETRLDKLESLLARSSDNVQSVAPLFAAMLALPMDRYPALNASPQRQKELIVEALAAQLARLARGTPILLVFEDVHWIDPTSLEALDHLVAAVADLPILMVITFRPEFEPRWGGMSHVTYHTLNRLGRRQCAAMIERVAGNKPLPASLSAQVIAKTDGVPLFIEELTKAVIESDIVVDAGDRYDLSGSVDAIAIPDTLHDSLMARLDQLIPVKEVAQIGAAIGREFSYQLVTALSPLSRPDLDAALDKLVESQLVHRRGSPPNATYIFKHALVQDAAYESLLRRDRQALHGEIAEALRTNMPSIADVEPELLAHHYAKAEMPERAVPLWLAAGQIASARASTDEALEHLKAGVSLISSLREGQERDDIELKLQSSLGFCLVARNGYADPDVRDVFERAETLLEASEPSPALCPILYAIAYYDWTTGNTHRGLDKFESMLHISRLYDDADVELVARQGIGSICLNRADYARAIEQTEEVLSSYEANKHSELRFVYGQDIYVAAASFVSGVHTHIGEFEKGAARAEAAVAHARTLNHPFSLAYALAMGGFGLAFAGASQNALAWSNEVISLDEAQGFPFWGAWGYLNRGCLARYQGRPKDAIVDLERGLELLDHIGGTGGKPAPLYELALAYIETDQLDLADAKLMESEEMIERSGEYLGRPLNLLARGHFCRATDGVQSERVAQYFADALDVAKQQGAKLEELCAATALARLWHSQCKAEEARDLLGPVYDSFTEGFDTTNLKEAKALLEQLK